MRLSRWIQKGRSLFARKRAEQAAADVSASESVEFCILVEAGVLEAQTVLLCRSIRRFAGAYSSAAIVAVSPRPDHRPAEATIKALERLGVEYLELNVRSLCPSYGPSLGTYVAGQIARRPGAPILVLLDSDTLFLAEPDFSLSGSDVAARPVDVKGMCTSGPGDPFDEYWHNLCLLCGVDYEQIPRIQTTVDCQTVLASYNAGLVAVRRNSGICEKTEEFFTKILEAKARPFAGSGLRVKSGTGMVDAEGSEYWGSRQAALSLAITWTKASRCILPLTYNIPLHVFDLLENVPDAPIHVHYHWLCSAESYRTNPMLDGRMKLQGPFVSWLEEQLPL
jgi:hypothetical protein